MSDGAGGGLVERARAAAARGDWQQAFDLLVEADADGLLATTDLPLLGEVAYAAGHLDVDHRGVGAGPRGVHRRPVTRSRRRVRRSGWRCTCSSTRR